MRRLLSMLVMVVMVLPLVPMGASAESSVPACCRRDGKHHCAMSMVTAEAAVGGMKVRGPVERCPYQQRALGAAHHERVVAAGTGEGAVVVLREPDAVAQAECLWRISFDRSRQKRGPPVFVS